MARKRVQRDVEARVLIRCRRCCCLCAFWQKDFDQKDGQIAHIDRKRSNANEDNLAYLCLPHHNQYDAKQRQGKNILPEEIRRARDELHRKLNLDRAALFDIKLTLRRDFKSFSVVEQQKFISYVKHVLAKNGDITVSQICPGSVNLTIELDARETECLFTAVEAGTFKRFGLVDARIVRAKPKPPEVHFWQTYRGGISAYILPENEVLDVVANPHTQQHILRGENVSYGSGRCALYAKTHGHSSDRYTALVISSMLHSHWLIGMGLRVYPSDVPHSPDWEPLDILKAFLDKYGVDETYAHLGSKRLFLSVPVPLPPFVRNELLALAYVHALRRHSMNEEGDLEVVNLHFYEELACRVFIEVAFAFSLRRYALDLRCHGFNLPSHFFERTPGNMP